MDNSGNVFRAPANGTYDVGLTKREWYAGMALQGMLCNTEAFENPKKAVRLAFELADAMLHQSGEGR